MFKECSSCGSLYNNECCCSNVSSVGKFVHDPNKAPDSPPHPHTFSSNQRHCFHGKDVLGDGEFCQRCTCMRCGSGLSKGLCLICASRNGNNLNPNSLNDSSNISENVSQSPPLIDHHCCYGCGDSLDGIFFHQCTCESCRNGAHYGYNCPPQVSIIFNPEPCNNQTVDELPQTLPSFDPTCYSGDGSSFIYDSTPNFVNDSPNVFNPPSQPPTYSCEFCGNDAHYGYDCPPQSNYSGFDQFEPPQHPIIHQPIQEKTCVELLAEERAANLDQLPPQEISIQDIEDLKQQYLDEMKSLINEIQIKDYRNEKIDIQYRRECEIKIDELKQNFNRMSIEISKKEKELMQQEQTAYIDFLLEEFAGELALIAPIPPRIVEADFDLKKDIRFIENLMYDNSFPRPPKTLEDDSETVIDSNNDYSLSDNDSLYSDDIDYVEASPPDYELVSLEVVEIFVPEVRGIDTDIILTIKDDIIHEKLLNVNLLIAKIEALKDNSTPSPDFVTKSSSTSLNFFLEETNTFDNSLPEYETFCFNLEEISSGSPTSDLSLPDYEAFFCDSEPDSGDFIMDVVEDIFDNPTREPRVHVPNVLPTHPTLQNLDIEREKK
ncbi:hypothetical protein Tco_0969629 [Tanacetum coccineum]